MLVAGSGRSGTSLFAGIVDNLGFHVPEPQVAMDRSNPRGFGEPAWVVNKHTALLRRANVHASDARPAAWAETARISFDEKIIEDVRRWLQGQFLGHEQVVIKDPRLLWFLPLWRRLGEDLGANVHVVTMLRHPAEVVRSKMFWYANMPLVDANRVAGWANTMLFTERATRDHRRAFVLFEDLLEDWTQPIARVSAQFGIPTLVDARARNQAWAANLVDPTLRRSEASWDDLDVPKDLVGLSERVWEDLLSLADPGTDDDGAVLERLDGHREEYVAYYNDAERVAQSTILAAGRSARQPAAKAPAKTPVEPGAIRQGSLAEFLLGQVRRQVPAGVRGMIPLRVKLALVNLFKR